MGHVVRDAENRFGFSAKPLLEEHPAVLPATIIPHHLRPGGHLPQPLAEAQAAQQTHDVRAELYARAHLAQLRGLLENLRVDPRAPQGHSGRQAADTATRDRDARVLVS